ATGNADARYKFPNGTPPGTTLTSTFDATILAADGVTIIGTVPANQPFTVPAGALVKSNVAFGGQFVIGGGGTVSVVLDNSFGFFTQFTIRGLTGILSADLELGVDVRPVSGSSVRVGLDGSAPISFINYDTAISVTDAIVSGAGVTVTTPEATTL